MNHTRLMELNSSLKSRYEAMSQEEKSSKKGRDLLMMIDRNAQAMKKQQAKVGVSNR